MCAGTLATEAKTSGKYHHFQVKCYVFKGPATIMRSHRNRKCSSMGKNGKGNCGKMLHFIEHLNVRGEMRCHREDPETVMYNNYYSWYSNPLGGAILPGFRFFTGYTGGHCVCAQCIVGKRSRFLKFPC